MVVARHVTAGGALPPNGGAGPGPWPGGAGGARRGPAAGSRGRLGGAGFPPVPLWTAAVRAQPAPLARGPEHAAGAGLCLAALPDAAVSPHPPEGCAQLPAALTLGLGTDLSRHAPEVRALRRPASVLSGGPQPWSSRGGARHGSRSRAASSCPEPWLGAPCPPRVPAARSSRPPHAGVGHAGGCCLAWACARPSGSRQGSVARR